ncbi:hypothetical protein MXMO3_03618 (plasmid) [Maritalea myrionectae]|uniref:Glycosyltransferase 2-like domain-containing protein n=1 Tax=Maritalea myrionectae TaxID=454601 RepID=A0A2R4MJF8_9HYPH|nr:glycosyltransferase family A protein [Maritalea myrionectae]AVX06121.1 hypothetical protein MXMO3_03618 [Maritalea myrionectae]
MLTIAISTLTSDLDKVFIPPRRPQVRWLILLQTDLAVESPLELSRPDVKIVKLDTLGVAKSRNEAITRAPTEFLLFADSGQEYCVDQALKLAAIMRSKPNLNIAVGQLYDFDNTPRKAYPKKQKRLNRFNCAKIGTPEIMLRTNLIKNKHIRFDPKFGAGSPTPIGDEYVFLADAINAGLRVEYFPFVLGRHCQHSSGMGELDGTALRHRNSVFTRVFGHFAFFARLGFALKHHRRFLNKMDLWRFVSYPKALRDGQTARKDKFTGTQ